ncbi:MAG: alanine racemase [Trueperaceae bacterium]|nr:alanine racemase [Trueperaceae bacterium]
MDEPRAPVPVAEVDLDALRRNVRRLRAHLAEGAAMLVAVKADAYGHGLVPVARTLVRAGVEALGVATPDEALALRRAGIDARILAFGPVYGPPLRRLVRAGIDLTLTDENDLRRAVDAAEDDVPVQLHLKVDTGMGRLGCRPEAAVALARAVALEPTAELAGVWTHFARADELASDATEGQRRTFEAVLARLAAEGIRPRIRHAANSAALLAHPATHLDMVRPGIAVYGYPPVTYAPGPEGPLEPVLRLRAPVVFTKRVQAGEAVSYGHAWRAPQATTIATLRIGYGDGYPRALSNLGEVGLPDGRRARVVGRVCMDQTMIDVGSADVEVGDRVDVWGGHGPGADALAERIGTISYELLTHVAPRVARRYHLRRSDAAG